MFKSKWKLNESLNIEKESIDVFKVLNGSLININFIKDDYDELLRLLNFVRSLENGKIIEIYKNAEVFYDNHDKIIRLLEYLNVLLFENSYFQLVEIVEKTKNKILMKVKKNSLVFYYCIIVV